jgi:hypothetical protein
MTPQSGYRQAVVISPFLALIALGGLSAGCATVIKGTKQDIPIGSDPSGARVTIDGKPAGTTPMTASLPRKRSHMVTVERDGYEVENTIITNSVGGAVAGNIIVGGLIGWGTDAISGGQYNLHPSVVSLKLRPKSPAGAAQARSNEQVQLFITELSRLDELLEARKIPPEEYQRLRTELFRRYQGEILPSPRTSAVSTP